MMNEYIETVCAFRSPSFLTMHKGETGWTPLQCSSDPDPGGGGWQTDRCKVKIDANASAKTEIFKRSGILSQKKVCVLSGGRHTQT